MYDGKHDDNLLNYESDELKHERMKTNYFYFVMYEEG